MKGPVTQTWCHAIPFMQQTVLLTAVRGPDGIPKYHPCKYLLRWFRRCTLVSSLGLDFTDESDDPPTLTLRCIPDEGVGSAQFYRPSRSGWALINSILAASSIMRAA